MMKSFFARLGWAALHGGALVATWLALDWVFGATSSLAADPVQSWIIASCGAWVALPEK